MFGLRRVGEYISWEKILTGILTYNILTQSSEYLAFCDCGPKASSDNLQTISLTTQLPGLQELEQLVE